jgi:hypothetical protein
MASSWAATTRATGAAHMRALLQRADASSATSSAALLPDCTARPNSSLIAPATRARVHTRANAVADTLSRKPRRWVGAAEAEAEGAGQALRQGEPTVLTLLCVTLLRKDFLLLQQCAERRCRTHAHRRAHDRAPSCTQRWGRR